MEIDRTHFSLRCCCTSSVNLIGWFSTENSTVNAL